MIAKAARSAGQSATMTAMNARLTLAAALISGAVIPMPGTAVAEPVLTACLVEPVVTVLTVCPVAPVVTVPIAGSLAVATS